MHQRYNRLAVISLATFPFGLVSVVTGIIAIRQIAKTQEKGKGLAIAGITLTLVTWSLGFAFAYVFWEGYEF